MNIAGIHPDQGPPLSVPFAFFFTAPLALVGAGALLLARGASVLASPDAPATLLLTHLGTLGFLTMVMFGAFFQMMPVIASARVPAIRVAHGIHAGLAGGLVVFALGALGKMPLTLSYRIGFGLIETAVLLFLVLAGVALGRTRARGEVVHGMRLVLAALLGTLILGTWMELAYGGATAVPNRGLWIRVHASFALLGWVGGLIGVVSWEVLPMFYLARPLRAWQRRLWLGLVYGGLGLAAGVLPLAALSPPLLGLRWMAAAAALPAIVAVGFVQPKWQADALRARLRRRADSSLGYWYVALALAPVTAAVAIVAAVVPDPRVRVLFVWLAVWGWAGVTVHGMLARIMPFLVWLHRYSGLVGRVPVPSIRSLLPDAWVAAALRAHVIALGIGVAAVLARNDALCRLLGASIAITALIVLAGMVRVVRAGVPRYAGAPEAPAVRTG